MPRIPRDATPDCTLALLLDPYRFISKRCRRYGSDIFEGRLMLQKTLFLSGPEAAGLFYDPRCFTQGSDGQAHRHRNRMFLSLLNPERIGQLVETAGGWWRAYARQWESMDRIVLYDEVREILTRAVCDWAGVPLREDEVRQRTRRLESKNADRWIAKIIEEIRARWIQQPEQIAAYLAAWHRDLDGGLLSPRVAAAELLNILRPTVAVSVCIVFIAHALHRYPEHRRELLEDDGAVERFVQEVRRFYPFFPSVVARVRDEFEWKGYRFPQGTRTLLDLYGTDHDERVWEAPEEFRPERFHHWNGSPFNFIPQGGGDHAINHRCPREWITIGLMKEATRFLARDLAYSVPEQDLRIDFSRLPALPRSRMVLSKVRVVP